MTLDIHCGRAEEGPQQVSSPQSKQTVVKEEGAAGTSRPFYAGHSPRQLSLGAPSLRAGAVEERSLARGGQPRSTAVQLWFPRRKYLCSAAVHKRRCSDAELLGPGQLARDIWLLSRFCSAASPLSSWDAVSLSWSTGTEASPVPGRSGFLYEQMLILGSPKITILGFWRRRDHSWKEEGFKQITGFS